MANFCLMLQYDGSHYEGWLRQPGSHHSIQGILEDLLSALYDQPISLIGAVNTDPGVHAAGQVANYQISRMASRYPAPEVHRYLNEHLPEDIRVLGMEKADERFDSRLSSTGALYECRIDCGSVHNVFARNYALRVTEPLHIGPMEEAAELMIGTYDFRSFCDMPKVKNTIRTVYSIQFSRTDGILTIRYHADGFLYHMVRIMTGTLLDVGVGELQPGQIPAILAAKKRDAGGTLIPAKGVFLKDIYYGEG